MSCSSCSSAVEAALLCLARSSSSAWPLPISGRSPIASLTVTVRSGAPPRAVCGTAVYCTPPGRLIVSCGDLNTWRTCGHSGSLSPGAAAQMNVRLRDCETPKLPALSTPKRTE